jgi:phosphatidylinositol-3-phosphatase
MFADEHNSESNYFWLFSGSNQHVGSRDVAPKVKFTAVNLGVDCQGLDLQGYSQSLAAIGADVAATPEGWSYPCVYGRKHVPWISFANVPDGTTICNFLEFALCRFCGRLQPAPDRRVCRSG